MTKGDTHPANQRIFNLDNSNLDDSNLSISILDISNLDISIFNMNICAHAQCRFYHAGNMFIVYSVLSDNNRFSVSTAFVYLQCSTANILTFIHAC